MNYLRTIIQAALMACIAVFSLNAWAQAESGQATEAAPEQVAEAPPVQKVNALAAQTKTKAKTETCVACHGLDGVGTAPAYPNLAGQDEGYLFQTLMEFKKGGTGARRNPVMVGMVAGLSEDDLAKLAAYYAAQEPVVGEADPALVAWGEKIYRGGILEEQVPACLACHGPQGEGNELANFPKLSGQHAEYVVAALKAYREGDERDGGPNNMMHGVTHHMTTYDMKAVASYIQGLH